MIIVSYLVIKKRMINVFFGNERFFFLETNLNNYYNFFHEFELIFLERNQQQ